MRFDRAFAFLSRSSGPRVVRVLFSAVPEGDSDYRISATILNPGEGAREIGFSAHGQGGEPVPRPIEILLGGAALSPAVRGEEAVLRAGDVVFGTLVDAVRSVPAGRYSVSAEERNLGIYFLGRSMTAWVLLRDPTVWREVRDEYSGATVGGKEVRDLLRRFVSP